MDEAALQRTWYLAGPMSHLPQFNYPTFFRVANALRNSGFTIISPAEQDTEEQLELILASEDGDITKIPQVGTWADFLAHDVKLIANEVSGIMLLPGWQKSSGARLECFIALTKKGDYDFMEVDEGQDGKLYLSNVRPDYIKAEVFKHV